MPIRRGTGDAARDRARIILFGALATVALVTSIFAASILRSLQAASPKELPAIAPSELSEGNWAIGPLQVSAAWERYGVSGAGVTVGIIDSGFDPKRAPDLAKRVVAYRDFTAGGTAEPTDPRGHGTAVAALVAGSGGRLPLGTAPGARLVIARVVAGVGRDVDPVAVDAALDWMASLDLDGNPATPDAPRVVNLSIGSDTGIADPAERSRDATLFERSTLEAYRKGIFLVAAAGNAGSTPGAITSPAVFAHVFAVGATDSDGLVANFSARGEPDVASGAVAKPDVAAPGTLVGTGDGASSTGTSFSAPLVAGIAALMIEATPGIQPGEIATILRRTATDRGAPGPDPAYGAGTVDASAALAALRAPRPDSASGPPRLVASSDLARAGSQVTTVVVGRPIPERGPVRVRIDRRRWSTSRYRPDEILDIGASGVLLGPLGKGCHRIDLRQEISKGRFSKTLTVLAGRCPKR